MVILIQAVVQEIIRTLTGEIEDLLVIKTETETETEKVDLEDPTETGLKVIDRIAMGPMIQLARQDHQEMIRDLEDHRDLHIRDLGLNPTGSQMQVELGNKIQMQKDPSLKNQAMFLNLL